MLLKEELKATADSISLQKQLLNTPEEVKTLSKNQEAAENTLHALRK
jgi:hypothetical protein